MMKIKSIFVAVLLMAGVVVAPANAAEIPEVEIFKVTPMEIDLQSQKTTASVELVVSHPNGIQNQSVLVTLTNNAKQSLGLTLVRTDSPVDLTLKKVKFLGNLNVPYSVQPGVYEVSTESILNNRSAGYQYGTGSIILENVRTLVGAENDFLIRSGGDLNFEYQTFAGPSYDATLGIAYKNPLKYNSENLPIWKVGETYKPLNYFESYVPALQLSVSTATPSVCSTDGLELKFIAEGPCRFKVFTPKTKDYGLLETQQNAVISAARVKSTLMVPTIAVQNFEGVSKTIETPAVYSAASGWVLPQSITPVVCLTNGFFVRINSAGTCKLTYQTAVTPLYLASDIYTVSFEILKDGKPVVVPTPTTTPTPVATPTPTAKPVVKKTITCVKGTKTIKKTAVSPKCPAGYKLKK
jgi:hypothetical protein